MLSADKLDQRITFQSKTVTRDEYGDPVESWADISTTPTVWAQVISEGGSEFIANASETAERPISALIRYRSDITDDMRLVWQGDSYRIVSVVERPRKGETVVKAIYTEGRV